MCILLLALSACSSSSDVSDPDGQGRIDKCKVSLGKSDLYSKDELQNAVDLIKERFQTMQGCVLHTLDYSGDENSERELAERNERKPDEQLTALIAFDASFHSPKEGGGTWTADKEYTWTWYVGKTADGTWKIIGYGYG